MYVILHGRLGKDPETTDKGNVKFSVADLDSKKDATEWRNVVCTFDSVKKYADYLHKGDLVCIRGHLSTVESKEGKTLIIIFADSIKQLSSTAVGEKKTPAKKESSGFDDL